jgi:hypothetical protein
MSSTVRQMLEEKVCLREPIVVDRSEEFLVEEEALEKISKGSDEVDVYLVGELGRLTDLMIPFAQRVKKPIISVPDVRPMQTIMPASLLARGLEAYSFRNWDDTLAFLDVLRVRKALAGRRSSARRASERPGASAAWTILSIWNTSLKCSVPSFASSIRTSCSTSPRSATPRRTRPCPAAAGSTPRKRILRKSTR